MQQLRSKGDLDLNQNGAVGAGTQTEGDLGTHPGRPLVVALVMGSPCWTPSPAFRVRGAGREKSGSLCVFLADTELLLRMVIFVPLRGEICVLLRMGGKEPLICGPAP